MSSPHIDTHTLQRQISSPILTIMDDTLNDTLDDTCTFQTVYFRCAEGQLSTCLHKTVQEDVVEKPAFKFTLRIRPLLSPQDVTSGGMLEVTFPYVLNVDTAVNVANEMKSSKFIEPEDVAIVASNIDDLVERFRDNRNLMEIPETNRTCIFQCKTGLIGQYRNIDDLHGFAKLTLIEIREKIQYEAFCSNNLDL